MEHKDIYDVMICPRCGESNCYEYSTDEISFDIDEGQYIVDCHCQDCNHNFRLYMKFKYSVTEAYTRQ